MDGAVLNRVQQDALAHYLLDIPVEGPEDAPASIHVAEGMVLVNGLWLHPDGMLGTYPAVLTS